MVLPIRRAFSSLCRYHLSHLSCSSHLRVPVSDVYKLAHTLLMTWHIPHGNVRLICGRGENFENGLTVGVQGNLDAYMGPLVNGRVALGGSVCVPILGRYSIYGFELRVLAFRDTASLVDSRVSLNSVNRRRVLAAELTWTRSFLARRTMKYLEGR